MDDVWRNVFKYLTVTERIRYERVCIRWMKLLREYWKELKSIDTTVLFVSVEFKSWNKCMKAILARCSRKLLSFSYGYEPLYGAHEPIKQLDPKIFSKLLRKSPFLATLKISRCFLPKETVSLLRKVPPVLQKIEEFFQEVSSDQMF
ncbi:unnamed protein product [Thelazia callipaeda]|uniref:F-box domain-containing protein n=1 Tax=Thelazia callipaeda TaxID=103827 RepID=A0A0N5D957_THECL|nr:unnamed protein product [Thelazia callipaeda]